MIAKAKDPSQEVAAYQRLHGLLAFFSQIIVLEYDHDAAERLVRLKRLRLRLGAMDLKIAAIALSQGALLLSGNLKDFQRVPDLLAEDWTK